MFDSWIGSGTAVLNMLRQTGEFPVRISLYEYFIEQRRHHGGGGGGGGGGGDIKMIKSINHDGGREGPEEVFSKMDIAASSPEGHIFVVVLVVVSLSIIIVDSFCSLIVNLPVPPVRIRPPS